MKPAEYTYTVLRYRHDPATAEQLNVAVLLYAKEVGQVGLLYSQRYSRLSDAFANFDGDLYRSVMGRLQQQLGVLSRHLSESLFALEEREKYNDAGEVLRALWPDEGLAYFAGPVRSGVTDDLDRELKDLYDRFILSQHDGRDLQSRFNDDQLWESFRKVLTNRGVGSVIGSKSLGPGEVEFEHAYKNDKWHVIEPVSLDYADNGRIKHKAYVVAGKATAVRDVEELGTFTVLLGKPRRSDAEKPYLAAKRILSDLPVPVRIVEEEQAEEFAAHLERELRDHGLLSSQS